MSADQQALAFELDGRSVWVAGHKGMVGQALVRQLKQYSCQILTTDRSEVDLCRQEQTERWIQTHKPDAIIVAAARVGGIQANDQYPADFIADNLAIELNIIRAAFETGVKKLLMLGSSCIYPKLAPQPMHEDALLTGPLEPTNEWYAIAKIAGIKLCQAFRKQHGCDFISAMPTNLYGPGDNFHLEKSHVVPALMRKMHQARLEREPVVEIWGTGKPRREFLHVDDCARALIHLMKYYSGMDHVNVGSGVDVSIAELAECIADVVGYEGQFRYNTSKPDGTPRKLMDVGRLSQLGWQAEIPLREGLAQTYEWYREQLGSRPELVRQ